MKLSVKKAFIAIAVTSLVLSCKGADNTVPAREGNVTAELPMFGASRIIPPESSVMTLVQRDGSSYSDRVVSTVGITGGLLRTNGRLDAGSITDLGMIYSNAATVADGKAIFAVPSAQTQTALDPASGRYMCMIADEVGVSAESEIEFGFQSLTSLVRVPVVNIPSGQKLSSISVKATGDAPFINELTLGAIAVNGVPTLGNALSDDDYSASVDVELAEPANSETVATFSVIPRYSIECLLSGAEPEKRDVMLDVTFTTVDASNAETDYEFRGCALDLSKLTFDGACILYNDGKAFELSGATPPVDAVISITGQERQLLRFGVDTERLWYYWPNQRARLAEMAVKDIHADYARVAINAAYEREEGNKDITAYTDDIIPMMTYMKQYNPDIKFFASTQPLKEAYPVNKNPEDAAFVAENFKNGNLAMYAYPLWVGGHKNVLIEEFKAFKKDNMVRYLADYLNLMKSYGFDIEWMDLVNEEQDMWGQDINNIIYVIDELPKHLEPGVQMPKIIFPSTWSPGDGFRRFLDLPSVKSDVRAIIDRLGAVSTHNTPDSDVDDFDKAGLYRFAEAVRAIDPEKEVWNTEAHGWVGVYDPAADIRNSAIFLEHIKAGFTGFDTWLFFGQWAGAGHPMVYSGNNNAPVTTAKFEIFKTVVNEMNLGRHIESVCDNDGVIQVVMRKGNRMMVCVLNSSDDDFDLTVELPAGVTVDGLVSDLLWRESAADIEAVRGADIAPEAGGSSFSVPVGEGSLECCVFNVK